MLGSNTKSDVTSKRNKTCVIKCWPSMDRMTKVSCRQHKQLNRSCNKVEGKRVGWCGIRSIVSSVGTRLTTGFANRRGILTSSNVLDQSHHLRSSKTVNMVNERAWNVPCTTEVEETDIGVQYPLLTDAEGGEDGTTSATSVGESEKGNDRRMKKAVDDGDGGGGGGDDGCSGWWWWDTAWYDLTSVTPVDVSTFWNELSSWLTTSLLDDDFSQTQTQPNIDNSSCNSSTLQHDMSLLVVHEDDAVESSYDGTDKLVHAERSAKKNETCWCGSSSKTALMRAASHGHRDVVCDILRPTTTDVRQVAPADTELHDLVNCFDSQVSHLTACC